MAAIWQAKAPTEVVERRWSVPLAADDGISAVSVSASGVTVNSSDHEGGDAAVVLSGGTAGTEATVTVTVTTDDGLTLIETFLIAVRALTVLHNTTARDVCDFALRKIVGNGETADATELSDALERLNDMIALWRIDGLDIGIAAVLASADQIDIPDPYVAALKYNLRLAVHDHYSAALSPLDVALADDSKRLVRNSLFKVAQLGMPGSLANPTDTVADLF